MTESKGRRTAEGITGEVFGPEGKEWPWRRVTERAETQAEYPAAASAAIEAGTGRCPKCLGDGRVAGGTDDLDPWPIWAALPPGSDLFVQLGMVYPVTCPQCGGTGEPS
jgi:hypothetical protein